MKIRVLISMAAIMATFFTFGATPMNHTPGNKAAAPELPELIFDKTQIELETRCEAAAIADLNGDNRPDLAISTSTYESGGNDLDYMLLVYLQQKDGTLGSMTFYPVGNGKDFVVIDVDGNGRNDVLVTGESGFGILYQLSNGTLSDVFWVPGRKCNRIAAGDVSGDGRIDVMTLDATLNAYQIALHKQGPTGFTTFTDLNTIIGRDVRIADVTGDGLKDALILAADGKLAVLPQSGSGAFAPPVYVDLETDADGFALATGDFTNDGVADLMASVGVSGQTLAVEQLTGGDPFPDSTQVTSLAYEPRALTLCDLNLDGRLDRVITQNGGGSLHIELQSFDGTFESAGDYTANEASGYGIRALAAGDLSGDKTPDLVLVNIDGDVTIYRQRATLLIPHIATEAQWDTYLALTNVGNVYSDAVITMYNPESGNRYQAFYVYPGKSVYTKLPSGTCGIVEYIGGNLIAREVFVNVEENGQGVAEFLLDGRSSPTFDIPLPAYNGDNLTWMGIAVFNPSDEAVTADLEAISESGVTLATAEIAIPAQERVVGILDTFFPEIDYLNTARVRVTSAYSLTGLAISGQNNEKLLFAPAAHDRSGGHLYIPHIAQISEGWTSWMVLDNTTDDSQMVTLTITGDTVQLGSFIYMISPRTSRLISLDDLVPDQERVEAGWVDVPEGVLVRESFINIDAEGGGTAEFLLSSDATPYLVLGYPWYAADVMTWWGLAVYNPTATQQTVTIRANDGDGQIRAASVDIEPYSRYRTLLTDLYPTLDPSTVARITVEGSGILTGLNISGAGTSRLLFAPAAAR